MSYRSGACEDMCYANINEKNRTKVKKDIDASVNNTVLPVLEHSDNVLIAPNLKNGVLGFRYETKNDVIITYSSPEAKAFCMLMKIKPI